MAQSDLYILSTRPLADAVIDQAKKQNIRIETESFIDIRFEPKEKIESILHSLPKNILAVVTSMNAVDAIRNADATDWKIYSIGNTTKELIEEYFKITSSGTANNAAELADIIIKKEQPTSVHFFCGDQRRDELPEKLKAAGFAVNEHVVYQTIPVPKQVKKKYDGILFYSPSAVKSYFEKNHSESGQIFFAIGETTADAIKQFTNETVIVADKPGKTELAELMLQYFQNKTLIK